MITNILKDKANSSAVFFFVGSVYHLQKPLLIEGANIAFVSAYGGDLPPTHEQVLYVTRPETFQGSLSTVIAGTKVGSNYTPEQATFGMERYCPNRFEKSNKDNLHYYQPRANPQPQSQADTAYIKSLNDKMDHFKNIIAFKFRKAIYAALSSLRNPSYKRQEPFVQDPVSQE